MKRILSATILALAVAFASPAQAEAQVALDLKVGYAIPTGDVVSVQAGGFTGAMSHFWSGAVPIEVAGRYRFTSHFSAGVYFQYDPAFVASFVCPSTAGCSGYDMRVGAEAVYAFRPDAGFNPWVSVGTGWEWSRFQLTESGVSASATFNGWEYFNVQVGGDFALSKAFAVGPYVGFFGGSYSGLSVNSPMQTESGSIDSTFRSFHGWWQFGVKGTLNL
jgi:hypothetical protein